MKSIQHIFCLGCYKVFGWDILPDGRIAPIFTSKNKMNEVEAANVAATITKYLIAEGFVNP